jgi:hypothetical protein
MVLFLGLLVPIGFGSLAGKVWAASTSRTVPSLAQIIDQTSFNTLATVLPPTVANGTIVRAQNSTNLDLLLMRFDKAFRLAWRNRGITQSQALSYLRR